MIKSLDLFVRLTGKPLAIKPRKVGIRNRYIPGNIVNFSLLNARIIPFSSLGEHDYEFNSKREKETQLLNCQNCTVKNGGVNGLKS